MTSNKITDLWRERSRREGEKPPDATNSLRNISTVMIGEFCGTFMFLLLSFIGTQTALVTNAAGTLGEPLQPMTLLYIASSFGSALAVNVWVFYRVTGGMFNPAVSSNSFLSLLGSSC